MTREDAIIHIGTLRTVTKDIPKYSGKGIDEAVDMAIEALEQEPCEDAISRQDALDCLTATGLKKFDFILDARDKIKNLPSVTPQYTDVEIQKMQELEQAEIQKAYELGKASQPKTGHCKDCKWWKNSDRVFRRGNGAESQCPINHIEVYEGNGYCYMFEPQESEDGEE